MEWIANISTGVLVVLMAARFGPDDAAARTVAVASAVTLLLAAVSSVTGGRAELILYGCVRPSSSFPPR